MGCNESGTTHNMPWDPTLVRTEPVDAECRKRSMKKKEKSTVHQDVKVRKRVRSRTATEGKL